MTDNHVLEGSPMWRLTDKQVLEAMRGRGNELETARTLASLCRVFQKAAETNPACAPGLMSAIGLTQMYGQGMAPGHEDHPFKDVDKNMTVASIMAGTSKPVLNTYKPPDTFKRWPKPKPTRVFDLDAHMEASRICVDFETHSGVPLAQPPGLANYDKPMAMVARVKAPSKVGIVSELALAMFEELGAEGVLTARGLHAKCPAGIGYQDVQNGLVALRRAGTVQKFGTSGYVKVAA